jgi:hypothetical protein
MLGVHENMDELAQLQYLLIIMNDVVLGVLTGFDQLLHLLLDRPHVVHPAYCIET